MVRVSSAQAQARIRALEGELAALQKQTVGTGAAMNGMGRYGLPFLSKWGNQVQWAGRQLQYNFTLPLIIAGGAATKFALDNEKAMTRVIKVYGDGSEVFNELSQTEIPALSQAFEELSSQFGVNQAQVIQIAGDWAAAGASGIALAKAVKLTLETMILGEMGAADATQSLIAIQAQYGQSTEDLAKTIDILNMVENQTGITMEGLIQGLARAAGVARSAGIDVQHLSAFMAALVPAAGSAANAGNALKTMISRLLSPTKEANEVLGLMGINTKELSWQSLNGAQRLEAMAKSFVKLDSAQKAVVSSTVASRWQINKFDVLMRDIINVNGYYQKSLNATSDATANYKQRVKELNIVLSSNPQRLKQVWTILQNALADVIVPLIPYIVYLSREVAKMMRAFANLDPAIQKTVLAALVFLAAIGPITRYVGSIANLFGILSVAVHFFGAKFAAVGKIVSMVVLGPFKLLGLWVLDAIGWAVGFATGFPALIAAGFARAGAAFAVLSTWREAMVAWWASMRALWAVNFIFLSGLAVRFGAVMKMIWAGNAAATTGIWTKLWATMVAIQKAGMMALAVISGRLLVLVSLFGWAGRNILLAWKTFTTTLLAIHTIALTRMKMISVAFALGEVGIFTRLGRTLIVIWQAVTMGLMAVWRTGVKGLLLTSALSLKQVGLVFLRFGKWLVSWPALVFFALLGIVYAFKDQLLQAWQGVVSFFQNSESGFAHAMQGIGNIFKSAIDWIVNAFWTLPSAVTGAIMAVLNVIKSAAIAIYHLFSYINPWAHHSPSLVESVTTGMDAIANQFARAKGIGAMFAQVASDLAKFKRIASSMGVAPWQQERIDVAKSYKQALPIFDALVRDWNKMTALLVKQKQAVDAQQAVVDSWKKKLDSANNALETQRKKLDALQNKLSDLQAAYDSHQQALENYANAPLAGLGAMEEAIFQNEMAQKRLRLEMLKWEQANGSLDDLQSKLQNIAGDLEVLRGEAASLRAAGAGSDILGPIEQQVAALEAQSNSLTDVINNSPMAEWQHQLDALQQQADIMDLEKSLQFDVLQHQIEQLVNTTQELTFDQIVSGIQNEQAAMAALQPHIDSVTAAIADQQAAVDAAEKARDAIQAKYDLESKKLDILQGKYARTEQAIRDIESALRDMASAANDASNALAASGGGEGGPQSPGAQNFLAAAGANFPDVGGAAKIGREGGLGDQSALIDEFTKGITDDIAKSFGSFDIFGPLKAKWNSAWGWVKENVGPKVGAVGAAIGSAFGSMENPFSGKSNFAKGFQNTFSLLIDIVKTAFDWISKIFDLFLPDIKRILKAFGKAFSQIWNKMGPELAKFGKLWIPLTKALQNIWTVAKPLVAIMAIGLVAAFKVLASIASKTLGPVLNLIVSLITDAIRVFRGFAEIIIGIFSGDLTLAIQGVKDMFSGTFAAIGNILKGAVQIIWGIISGLVTGIVEFFQWLYDVLVGHSIVPDLVNGIIYFFKLLIVVPKWIWDHVLKPVYDFFVDLWAKKIRPELAQWWARIKAVWSVLAAIGGWVWDHVLKPVADFFSNLWSDHVKPGLADWWDGIKNVWSGLTKIAGWVWDNVLSPIWDKFNDVLDKIRGLKDSFFNVGKSLFTNMIDGIKAATGTIANLANAIWESLKGIIETYVLQPIRNALNFTIDPPGPLGPWHFNFGDVIPQLYTGGVVKGSRLGTLAIIGDRGHDEAVVPLSGPFAPKGIPAGANSAGKGDSTYNFYGDLEFPNITDGSDAETFIKNLEILAG